VTSDASGNATFNVSTNVPGPVSVVLRFKNQPVYTTTIDFTAATAKSPAGRPSIARLTAISGGLVLLVRPPSSNGGSAITSYQYSINKGARWITLPNGATSIRVVNLARTRTYSVIVRALNAAGASAASTPRSIVTRK
jgi:hypothetical protein